MAQNYKIRLKRWNGIDFDTLNFSSENVLMNSGENVENEILGRAKINDNQTTSTNAWSAQKIQEELSTLSSNLKPKLKNITLSSTWNGSGPYTQTVNITGETITEKTKVDIQPDSTVLTAMMNSGIYGMYIENNNGVLTAYSIGAKPSSSLNIQISLIEVR